MNKKFNIYLITLCVCGMTSLMAIGHPFHLHFEFIPPKPKEYDPNVDPLPKNWQDYDGRDRDRENIRNEDNTAAEPREPEGPSGTN